MRWFDPAYQNLVVGAANTTLDGSETTLISQGGALREMNLLDLGGVVNVKSPTFGAKGDGVTDDTAAIRAAVSALGSLGGTVYFPKGIYIYTAQLDLSDLQSITFKGDGSMGLPDTQLRYTGTGATSAVKLGSSYGFHSDGIFWSYSSSSFTGALLDFTKLVSSTHGDTIFGTIENGRIGSSAGGIRSASSLILFDNAQTMTVRRMYHSGATVGIIGRTVSANFSNAITVEECYFDSMTTVCIKDPYTGWDVHGNVFEPLASGANGCVSFSSYAAVPIGFNFVGNWIGDSSAGGTMILLDANQSVNISGNYMAGDGAATCVKFNANNTKGVTITGNGMSGSVGIDFNSTTGHISLGVLGNANSCSTRIANYTHADARNVVEGDIGFLGDHVTGHGGPAYSASMTPNMNTGDWQFISANNGVAFTVNNPTNAIDGQSLFLTIFNFSVGALGAITFGGAYKMLAFTPPNSGFNCTLHFKNNAGTWYQMSPQSLQIPN